jgi:hypothetical protein
VLLPRPWCKHPCKPLAKVHDSRPLFIVYGLMLGLPLEQPVSNEPKHDIHEEQLSDPKPLRTLASLKWPYVPEPPSFVDPVTKNDPKPLTLAQYEAIGMTLSVLYSRCQCTEISIIATSPEVRKVLVENPNVRTLLSSIDQLYGPLRQQAIEEVLGVGTSAEQRHGTRPLHHDALARLRQEGDPEGNTRALRQLSEAIERAVGVKDTQRGLAWENK